MMGMKQLLAKNNLAELFLYAAVGVYTWVLVVRGADYFRMPPHGHGRIPEIGTSAPPMVWGILCLIGAAGVIIGAVARNFSVLSAACGLNTAIYAAFVFFQMVSSGLGSFRFPGSYVGWMLLWLLACAFFSVKDEVVKARRRKHE